MKLFITEDVGHQVDDRACAVCMEGYPASCRCGGLLHAELGGEADADGNYPVLTRCDHCGRSEDQLDEV